MIPLPHRHLLQRVSARLFALVAIVVLTLLSEIAGAQVCGTPGRDGPGGTLSGVINTYYAAPLAGATASAGATSIPVGSSFGAGTPIAIGDLLLVIQMQDAAVNFTSGTTSSRYGANVNGQGGGATSWGTAGQFEYVVATSAVSSGSVSIRGTGAGNGLVNTYTSSDYNSTTLVAQKRYQVIRVPQYSTATLGSGLTALAWNGRAGGVLVFDVAGTLTLGGATVSVAGKGFRGGGGRQLNGVAGGSNNDYRNLSTYAFHGQKGEGVGGTPRYVWDGSSITDTGIEGYPNGSSARGSPANGGGGGTDGNPNSNDENSGGGGGAGYGAGGVGGKSWNSNLAVGGVGGFAPTVSTGVIIMGGGGGAGSTNNGTGTNANGNGSSGAPGGGLIMIRTGSVSGVGTLNADGANASNSVTNDGSGGGGGGGGIMFYTASNSTTGLTAQARGGSGGTNTGGGSAHGPGGGGGGGLIAVSGGGASMSVTGGAAGTTAGATTYGAAAGAAGQTFTTLVAGNIPGASPSSACLPTFSVAKTTPTASLAAGSTTTYTITVTSSTANRGRADSVRISDVLPAGFTYVSNAAPVLSSGTYALTSETPTAGATTVNFGSWSIPASGTVTITFTVQISGRAATGLRNNSATALWADPTRTISTAQSSALFDGTVSATENITVTGVPDLKITKSHTGNFVAGRPAAYTLTPRNNGTLATSGTITITDVLPTGLTYSSATGTGWTCGNAGQTVTCTSTTVIPLATDGNVVTLNVSVLSTAVPGVTNTASISGGGEPSINNDDNASSDATTVILAAVAVTPDGATITKLPSNGTQYTQTFVIANNGSASDSFTLTVSRVPGNRTKTVSVNGVAGATTTLTIASGASANVNVIYTVDDTASAGTSDVVKLTATSGTDNTKSDLGDLTVNIIRAGIVMTKQLYRDDQVTLIGPTDKVNPGEFVQFKVTVTSSGGAAATTVHVTDALPGAVIFDSYAGDAAGWTVSNTAGTITADLSGTLATGASRFFWIRVKVR